MNVNYKKRTFFEHLGLADMEKVHSQIFKWILSTDNDALTTEQRTDFIADFFNINDFKISQVLTEYKNIDILIKSEKTIIAIENKLKSSQHSNQLEKYQKITTQDFPDKELKHYYLTLINESSQSVLWTNKCYSELLKSLNKLKVPNNTHGLILKEYIQTIKKLVTIIDEFLTSPKDFDNVFRDGSKTKFEKSEIEKSDKKSFISDNQLETIFQKLYLKKVAEKLTNEKIRIFESHGNAILQVILKENYKAENGKSFLFALDYQNGTFKTHCIIEGSDEYKNSTPDDVPESIKQLFKSAFENKNYGFERIPKPKTKATYSITKNYKKAIGIDIDYFYELFQRELLISKKIIENVNNVC